MGKQRHGRRLRQDINRGSGIHKDLKKEMKKNPDWDEYGSRIKSSPEQVEE